MRKDFGLILSAAASLHLAMPATKSAAVINDHEAAIGREGDLKITPIGVGPWAVGGGKWELAWGHQDDAQSIAAIHVAIDSGVNWIDTAAVYGPGHSETVVGTPFEVLALALCLHKVQHGVG